MASITAIDAISTVRPDAPNDVVHVEFTSGEGLAHLNIRSGAISTLALGLRQAAQAFQSDEFYGQPLELTGAGLISLEDGRIMLELVFDGSLRVCADVPPPAMPALQECLYALGELRDVAAREQAGATQH